VRLVRREGAGGERVEGLCLDADLAGHINATVAAVGPQSWVVDVVNEPVCDTCASGQILKYGQNGVWYPNVTNYIPIALSTARAAAIKAGNPNLKLFINDYGAEDMGAKSDRMYTLVQELQSQNVPLDGIGLQMHVSITYYPNATQVSENMARLGALGITTQITEMDFDCINCTSAQLEIEAAVYGDMLTACLENFPHCSGFFTWGFTDLHSWLWYVPTLSTEIAPILPPPPITSFPSPLQVLQQPYGLEPAGAPLRHQLPPQARGVRDPRRASERRGRQPRSHAPLVAPQPQALGGSGGVWA
jgi:Glycosyl hydrolase family 10